MEEITGTFDRFLYTSEDGSFMIGSLRDRTAIKGFVIDGRPPLPNLDYRFTGKWESHPKYGRQFKFNAYAVQEPRSREAVITYLLRYTKDCGIGSINAAKIVDQFGPDKALGVLKWEPERVAKAVKRVSLENARKASEQLKECAQLESTMIELGDLLNGRGFPQATVQQIVRKWRARAPEIIRRDPFKLLVHGFPGAGFSRCDTLYADLGLPPGRLKRQMICAWDFIRKDMTGSIWFPVKRVAVHVRETCAGETDIDRAIELGERAGWLKTEWIEGERWLSSESDSGDEEMVAECVLGMIGVDGKKVVVGNRDQMKWAANERRRVMG